MAHSTAWARCSAIVALVGLALTWNAGPAWAAACCVGSTSDKAGLLGPCEAVVLSVGYSAEVSAFDWDASGELRAPSLMRVTHRLSGMAAFRLDDYAQVGIAMPVLIQGVRAGSVKGAGIGPGDLRTWITFEPTAAHIGPGPPQPRITLAMIAPTGIPPEQAQQTLAADATGTGYLRFAPSFDLEKQGFKGLIRFTIDGSFAVPRPWVEGFNLPGIGVGGSVSGAVFLNSGATLAWGGGAMARSRGWYEGNPSGKAGVEPWASFGVSLNGRRFDRVGLGVRAALPIPGVGRSQSGSVTLAFTYSHLQR